ncbi:MFS transporter [Fimbriimonas ginsengisoli]|uniref:Major facilitator superfamily MFS_1 n=1 Tax=Fimbriimonas ginsengisoli Gsoil 348 TaxID=661478 RepID=A0A068NQW9_FIMGI|nr:MFS transporter [Fimbriimonas ginsengisoli]AIE83984.1 major facilitator superfamily MFS_1 [Fimbriimonas ginsengisoli Gsoil 348]
MANPLTTTEPATPNKALLRRPTVLRLLIVALLAEIGYAVLNLSTMTIYLRDDRHFGEATVGWVVVSFLLVEALFKSPMGHLADRFGPKMFMLLGPAMSAVTAVLSLVVPRTGGAPFEVFLFILLRAIDGLGAAMLWPAAFLRMNDAVADDERQQGMSLMNLCYMLGIAVAFPLGGAANDIATQILQRHGMGPIRWAALILASSLFAAVAIAVWRLVPSGKPKHAHVEEVATNEVGLADFLKSMRQIPSYLLLATVTFAGIGFPMVIFKLFPVDQFGFSETQIGFLILPGAAVLAACSVPMSKFGEKIGRVKAVHLGLGLCTIGMAAIGSGMFLPLLRQPWLLALGGIPVGIGFLLAIPAWMASVSDIDPQRRGTNIGAVMTAQGLGAIVGAPIGSAMYEKLQPLGRQLGLTEAFGRYSPFVGCAVCLLIGWLISLRILKPRSEAV